MAFPSNNASVSILPIFPVPIIPISNVPTSFTDQLSYYAMKAQWDLYPKIFYVNLDKKGMFCMTEWIRRIKLCFNWSYYYSISWDILFFSFRKRKFAKKC